MNIRKRIWEIVEVAKPGDAASRLFDISIIGLIFLNLIAVILGTVKPIEAQYDMELKYFEIFSVAVFTFEYLARLWSCVENSHYRSFLTGRLRFAAKPMLIIDMLAILPSYLPFIGIDTRFLRILRMFRILRVLKIGRYSASLNLILSVLRSKKEELIMTTAVMSLLLVLSSCLMFYCENEAQPDVFPNIPATMWWSVATLTTVGYGDVYPITPLGKIFASMIAVLGIGMFALPTGLLGAGFVEEIQNRKSKNSAICPHCGERIKL